MDASWGLLVAEFAATYVALFVIVDPFAVVGVYTTLTHGQPRIERNRIALKATGIAFMLLLAFALLGMRVFNFFGISMPAFQIAGGILLLLTGISQLSAERKRVKKEEQRESDERDDISVFPIAMPLLAGPGSLSTVVLLATDLDDATGRTVLIAAIFSVMLTVWLTLRSAGLISRALGKTGLNILTRLMGILLTAIAIQFMLNGLADAYRALMAGGLG